MFVLVTQHHLWVSWRDQTIASLETSQLSGFLPLEKSKPNIFALKENLSLIIKSLQLFVSFFPNFLNLLVCWAITTWHQFQIWSVLHIPKKCKLLWFVIIVYLGGRTRDLEFTKIWLDKMVNAFEGKHLVYRRVWFVPDFTSKQKLPRNNLSHCQQSHAISFLSWSLHHRVSKLPPTIGDEIVELVIMVVQNKNMLVPNKPMK